MKTSYTLSALLFSGFLVLLFIPWSNQGRSLSIQPRSIFEWLEQPEVLKITMETDLHALMDDPSNDTYQPALFTFWDAMGQQQEFLTEIKPRGKYRRRVCDFPPLKVKFPKDELAKRGLGDYNTLKLVTHCLSDQADGKDNLLREYLAYEFYQELTPMSYRVKLAEITYIDSKKRNKSITRTAFFLEPTDELVDRLDGEEVENFGISIDQLEPRNSLEMRTFEYMIGNSDWDVPNLRNIKLVRHKSTGDLFAIPYDFDLAGWVDASYAVPNTNIGQYDVKDRFFMGNMPSLEAWNQCLTRFEHARNDLESHIQSIDGLSSGAQRELLRYLETFFNRDGKRLAKLMQLETERA
ncbi:MAG: hypothetical protein IPL49_21220 [Saprospirales bacterium]|nr:hypothetical protein [Saprospirales bacterium]